MMKLISKLSSLPQCAPWHSDVWLLPFPRLQRQLHRGSTPTQCCSSFSNLKGKLHVHTPVFGPCCMLSIVHPNILELILISSWLHHLTCHFLLSFRYRIVTPHILTTLLQDVKVIGSLISSQTYFRSIINKHPPPPPPKSSWVRPSRTSVCCATAAGSTWVWQPAGRRARV